MRITEGSKSSSIEPNTPNTHHPLVSQRRCTIALDPCAASRRRQSPTVTPCRRSLHYPSALCLRQPLPRSSIAVIHPPPSAIFSLDFFFLLPSGPNPQISTTIHRQRTLYTSFCYHRSHRHTNASRCFCCCCCRSHPFTPTPLAIVLISRNILKAPSALGCI